MAYRVTAYSLIPTPNEPPQDREAVHRVLVERGWYGTNHRETEEAARALADAIRAALMTAQPPFPMRVFINIEERREGSGLHLINTIRVERDV